MKAIVITTQGVVTCRIAFDTDTMKKSKHMIPAIAEGTNSTRINALNACVTVMRQLKESKLKSTNTETGEVPTAMPTVLYLNKLLSSAIQNGYALYWFANDGKTSQDKDVSPKEIELWKEFYALHADLITDVIFKDSSDFVNSKKNSKFRVSSVDTEVIKMINASWDEVKKSQVIVEEIDSEEI